MRLLEFDRRTFIYYIADKRSNRAEKQSLMNFIVQHTAANFPIVMYLQIFYVHIKIKTSLFFSRSMCVIIVAKNEGIIMVIFD